jgi:DNA-binding transcriptional MerR regulator
MAGQPNDHRLDHERMTIDELAHRSGTATSTIRLYQTKRLLPPPIREGRVGYYGPGHLARLGLIAQLQEEGFSLAGIGRLVDAWEQGRGLDTVLGLEEQIAATWADEQPLSLSPEEFAARFAGVEVTPEQIQRSVALGLVRLEDDRIVITSPRFLDIGSELTALGVPLDASLDEYELLSDTTLAIADRFIGLFDVHLWKPVVDSGLAADEVATLATVLQRLSALAEGVVTVTLRRSLKRAAAAFVAAQAAQLRDAGVLDTVRPLAAAAGVDLDAE